MIKIAICLRQTKERKRAAIIWWTITVNMSNPFSDSVIRDWLFAQSDLQWNDATILIDGFGPFDKTDLTDFLSKYPFDVQQLNAFSGYISGTLVIGQSGWNEELLQSLLHLRSGNTLRVYSQEMFLTLLLTGNDPFDASNEVLQHYAEGHPALEYLADLGFDWPSTIVYGTGQNDIEASWPQVGFLKYMGYKVGSSGIKDAARRREVLKRTFQNELPNVNSRAYMEEWGSPNSSKRLQKIANSIAAFCSLNKRKDSPSELAISHWEEDLNWLHDNYYRGRFNFSWPNTEAY